MRFKLYILVISLLSISHLASSQDDTAEIDSLKEVVASKNVHDTTLLKALIAWDNLIYYSDPELDIELNERILAITKEKTRHLPAGLDAINTWYVKARAYALNSLGAISMEKGEFDNALPYFTEAFKLYKKADHKRGMSSVINNKGIIFQKQGNYPKALEMFIQCLEIEESRNDSTAISQTYNNIGIVHEKIMDYEAASTYFLKSLHLKKVLGDKKGMASTYQNLGNLKDDAEEYDSSLYYYNKSLEIETELGNTVGQGQTYLSIAIVYDDLDNSDTALYLLNKALDIAREHEITYLMSLAYVHIGQLHNKFKNFSTALPYCDSSLAIAQKERTLMIESDACNCHYLALKGLNRKDEALAYFERFFELKDSIVNTEHDRNIIRMEYQFRNQQRIKEDSLQSAQIAQIHSAEIRAEQEEKKRLRNQNYLTFAILGIICLAALILLNRFRLIRKQKNIIEQQKHEVSEKNKAILDSITYAKRIQKAILPPKDTIDKLLPNAFVLYKPKDIVAGDFYWLEKRNNTLLVAAADCTGHGVPGAMVSVVCHNGLNRAVREHGLTEPGKILDKTLEIVQEEFGKSSDEVRDGMDIALLAIEGNQLQYAGAFNPLWIVRKTIDNPNVIKDLSTPVEMTSNEYELIEIKADKQAVGAHSRHLPFTTHNYTLSKGDTVYIFSDGYADQFGGENGKKLKSTNFKKLILEIQSKSMSEQKAHLYQFFESWRGKIEQIDDVCVIGFKV